MLNLRQIDTADDTHNARRLSTFSAPQFRVSDSVFGNFAEPLEHGALLLDERMETPRLLDEPLQQELEHSRLQDVENLESTSPRCGFMVGVSVFHQAGCNGVLDRLDSASVQGTHELNQEGSGPERTTAHRRRVEGRG